MIQPQKGWNNAICSNMDGTRGYHTKWSKSERQIPYNITYMWNLKMWHKWTYLQNKNRLTDIESRLVAAKGVEGGMDGCLGLANASYYIRMGKPQVLHTV